MQASATQISFAAPAKVNLYLAVGALRSDGYHDVTTVLQTIGLADEVTLRPSASLAVTCEPDVGVPESDNLAYRAAEALARRLGREPTVAIHVQKRIPSGAGLGGGSSNAAAVLAALGALWRLDDPEMLRRVAASLGADVPFFLSGGTAVYGGRGDIELRRLPTPPLDLVLVYPGVSVSTARAYEAFDRRAPGDGVPVETMVTACVEGDSETIGSALYNNMTEASTGLVAQVAEAIAFTQDADGVLGACMCGSGSAVFAVCSDGRSARELVVRARARGWYALETVTIDQGVHETSREERQ